MEKQKAKDQKQKILELTRDFCTKKLDEQYIKLTERLIQKLSRKRDLPLAFGKPEIWAASIIHAVGWVNFLFDKYSEPYLSTDELNEFFGTNKETTSRKSARVRNLFKIAWYHSEYSTKETSAKNPFNFYSRPSFNHCNPRSSFEEAK